jgi:pyruvate formate lyase activating enzyme
VRVVDHYTRPLADGRILCEVCPRICNIGPGERGHCYVRENRDGRMALTTDGLVSALRVEAIESQRLNHFLPGAVALIVGAAGCNLGCACCDVHDPAKSRAVAAGAQRAAPEEIALAASERGCACVVFADNDPVVFYEYAIDIAWACRARGIRTVAATAGYISPGPREEFFAAIDAASVDLKAFSERFYYRRAGGHLTPVLDTLKYIRRETDVWLEITTLLIPGENDSEAEIDALTRWVVEELGDETPLHFTAFQPGYRMLALPSTPKATLMRARAQARANGLRHVYVRDGDGQATICAGCGAPVIGRDGDRLTSYALDGEGACRDCGRMLAGHFAPTRGDCDGRRMAVDIEAW